MKFKPGELVVAGKKHAPYGSFCIVLGRFEAGFVCPDIYYKVYVINQQCITEIPDFWLSPMNPQEAQSEV